MRGLRGGFWGEGVGESLCLRWLEICEAALRKTHSQAALGNDRGQGEGEKNFLKGIANR